MANCYTAPATGSRSAVYIGQEVCWGIPVRPTHLQSFNSDGLAATEETIQSEALRANRAVSQLVVGNRSVGGDLTSELSAKGFGMLIYNALGDYLPLEDTSASGGAADAGIHARVQASLFTLADAVGGGSYDATADAVIELTEDSPVHFANEASDNYFAVISRTGLQRVLNFDDAVGAGFEYKSYGQREVSYITNVAAVAADPLHGVAGCTPITLAQVIDETGTAVDPDVNLNGGWCYIGNLRTRLPYLSAAKTGSGTVLYLQPSTLTASGITPAVDDIVIVAPTLVAASSLGLSLPGSLGKGSWLVQWYPAGLPSGIDYSEVHGHYFEAGERLPEGLTIEINRDAAYFLYSGMKVNTWALEFATGAIVSSTFSFLGKKEYAMGVLVEDAIPAQTSIVIEKGEHFPDPTLFPAGDQIAYITLGEERDISYTGITDNGDGTFTLTGIPAAGDGAITRPHLKDLTNVDVRSSRTNEGIDVNPVYEGNFAPLTSFETMVYINGYAEEVLSASLTLSNNINDGKYGLGQRYVFALPEERRSVEGSLNVEFDDGKLYKMFQEGDKFSVEFRCISEDQDSEIGQTDILHSASFICVKCKFNGTTPNATDQSFIQTDMPFTAVYDDEYGNAELIVFLTNSGLQDVVYA